MSLENVSAFYLPGDDPDTVVATSASAGPWGPALQHAGPPSALAARAIERLSGDDGLRVAKLTVDILRPVPVAPTTVTAKVVRPGRRVQLVDATVACGGEAVLRVAAWRVAAVPAAVEAAGAPGAPPPLPDAHALPLSDMFHVDGYMSAVEWRFVSGGFEEAGPAVAWMRPRLPLVAGEEMTPLQRVLLLADSAQGIGASVDRSRWLAINTDLAVSLHRDPVGDWLCLDAATALRPGGAATTETVLSDTGGVVGRASQTLLVDAYAA